MGARNRGPRPDLVTIQPNNGWPSSPSFSPPFAFDEGRDSTADPVGRCLPGLHPLQRETLARTSKEDRTGSLHAYGPPPFLSLGRVALVSDAVPPWSPSGPVAAGGRAAGRPNPLSLSSGVARALLVASRPFRPSGRACRPPGV
jgi:hypothetical protein